MICVKSHGKASDGPIKVSVYDDESGGEGGGGMSVAWTEGSRRPGVAPMGDQAPVWWSLRWGMAPQMSKKGGGVSSTTPQPHVADKNGKRAYLVVDAM